MSTSLSSASATETMRPTSVRTAGQLGWPAICTGPALIRAGAASGLVAWAEDAVPAAGGPERPSAGSPAHPPGRTTEPWRPFSTRSWTGIALPQVGDVADQPDAAPAVAQIVEDPHHLVEGLVVEGPEPLVDEEGLQQRAAGLGRDHVGEAQRQRQGGGEALAARQARRVALAPVQASRTRSRSPPRPRPPPPAGVCSERVAPRRHPQQPSGRARRPAPAGREHVGLQAHPQPVVGALALGQPGRVHADPACSSAQRAPAGATPRSQAAGGRARRQRRISAAPRATRSRPAARSACLGGPARSAGRSGAADRAAATRSGSASCSVRTARPRAARRRAGWTSRAGRRPGRGRGGRRVEPGRGRVGGRGAGLSRRRCRRPRAARRLGKRRRQALRAGRPAAAAGGRSAHRAASTPRRVDGRQQRARAGRVLGDPGRAQPLRGVAARPAREPGLRSRAEGGHRVLRQLVGRDGQRPGRRIRGRASCRGDLRGPVRGRLPRPPRRATAPRGLEPRERLRRARALAASARRRRARRAASSVRRSTSPRPSVAGAGVPSPRTPRTVRRRRRWPPVQRRCREARLPELSQCSWAAVRLRAGGQDVGALLRRPPARPRDGAAAGRVGGPDRFEPAARQSLGVGRGLGRMRALLQRGPVRLPAVGQCRRLLELVAARPGGPARAWR